MNKNRSLILLLPMAIALAISSCSYLPEPTSTETVVGRDRRGHDTGSLLTGRKKSGITLDDITGRKSGLTLPINALLWRASIDTLSVMPLSSVDAFGGAIITEWYRHPDDKTKRIRIVAFVLDQELRSDAINAEVYVQQRRAGTAEWVDAGRDKTLATRLEDLILTRAREIRSAGVSETN
jgi:hypothetical protein